MSAPNAMKPGAGKTPGGGAFLVNKCGDHEIFTPEKFDNDTLEIGRTAERLLLGEVKPAEERLEKQEPGLMVSFLKKAGELGLFMIDIPEQYGGLDLPKSVSMLVAEKVAYNADFSVTFGAHAGIGTLPIVFFGTDEQKARYLPKLATGELIGAYALSEPGSGSDALGARCKAILNEAGTHYLLNGTKQWITNAAWADVFVVFAQVDGDKFSAFIVEKDTPGFSLGPEENKLGIKGSSTRALIFEDAPVPKENLLGEIGKGHKIAFNILNVGRFKLGVGVTGGAKHIQTEGVKYAAERKQFGTPIIELGAIRQKIADMAILTYAMESLCYRIAGYMDNLSEGLDHGAPDYAKKLMHVIEEYAIESSIAKVYCSEGLGMVIDESLQIHGGYGFVKEYPVEKPYRDCRVNRIFEGTNEINRLLIPGMLLKRAMGGKLPLLQLVQGIEGELKEGARAEVPALSADAPLAREVFAADQMKKAAALIMGAMAQKFMTAIEKEQEVLLAVADMVMDVYAVDSTVHRTLQRIRDEGAAALGAQIAATRALTVEATDRLHMRARRLAVDVFGEKAGKLLDKIDRLLPTLPTSAIAEKRLVADHITRDLKYNLSRV
ncbi:MAG: acyl-CoA dehydrogenase [Myxococcales bacterium]